MREDVTGDRVTPPRRPSTTSWRRCGASATTCTIACCARRPNSTTTASARTASGASCPTRSPPTSIRDLLPVVDDLERALAAPAGLGRRGATRRGVELIHRQLLEALRRRGVEPLESVGPGRSIRRGTRPSRASRPNGRRDGEITAEIRRGYRIGQRLLRPAHGEGGQGVSQRDYYEVLGVARDAERAGHQERVPQAGAEAPSRSQPRRHGGRRTLQGSGRGLRGARRRRQARALRPVRPRRRRRRGRRPAARASTPTSSRTSPTSSATSSASAAAAAPRRPGARRRPALRPRDRVRGVVHRHRDDDPDSARGDVRDVQGHRARRPARRARPVRSAAAPASCATSRASSSSRARAASAAARARSSGTPCTACRGTGRVTQRSPRHRADSRRHRRRPAPAPPRRGRARRRRRADRRSLRRHSRAAARRVPPRRRRPVRRSPRAVPHHGDGRTFKVDGPAGALDVDVSAGTAERHAHPASAARACRASAAAAAARFYVRARRRRAEEADQGPEEARRAARQDDAGREDRAAPADEATARSRSSRRSKTSSGEPRSIPALDVSWSTPAGRRRGRTGCWRRSTTTIPSRVEDARRRRAHLLSLRRRSRARGAFARGAHHAGVVCTPVDVPDEDWAERSQASLEPVTVGRLIVAPPWREAEARNRRDRSGAPLHRDRHPAVDGLRHRAPRVDAPVPDAAATPVARWARACSTSARARACSRLPRRSSARPTSSAIDDDPDALQSAAENIGLNGADARGAASTGGPRRRRRRPRRVRTLRSRRSPT